MKKYRNSTSNTLTFTLGNGSEHVIGSGSVAELPSKNEYIVSLVAQGCLTIVEEPKPKTNDPK
jgi:hypothetical protein